MVVLAIHWLSLRLLPVTKVTAKYHVTTVEAMAVATISMDYRLSAAKH
jgi:hypothetical protein